MQMELCSMDYSGVPSGPNLLHHAPMINLKHPADQLKAAGVETHLLPSLLMPRVELNLTGSPTSKPNGFPTCR